MILVDTTPGAITIYINNKAPALNIRDPQTADKALVAQTLTPIFIVGSLNSGGICVW